MPIEAVTFFPLLPDLGWLLHGALGGNHGVALVLVANVAALLAAMALRGLVRDTTGDEALADRAAWYLNLFPTAAVFVFASGESFLLLCSLVYLGAIR